MQVRATALLAAASLAVVLLVGIAALGAEAVGAALRRSDQAHVLQADNGAFLTAMWDQETAIRGYVNTGDPQFRDIYLGARTRTAAALDRLEGKVGDGELAADVARAKATAAAWQAWAERRRATVDAAGKAVIDPGLSLEGKSLFDAFRDADDVVVEQAAAEVNATLADARARQRFALIGVLFAGAAGALALISLSLLFLRLVLRPITGLARVARLLAAGQAPAVPGASRKDELGDLARALTAWQGVVAERDRFFNLSVDLLVIAGVDGRFKQLNAAWEKTVGFTTEELRARPYLEFVHPEDRAATRVEARKIATGIAPTVSFENRYLCKDGSYKWLAWTAAAYLADGLIYAVARDITERKRTQEALRESGERLRAVLENLADGLVTMSEQGILQSFNPAAQALFGYPSDEILGHNIKLLVAEPYQREFVSHLSTYLRPEKKRLRSGSHETIGRRKDGSSFPLEFIASEMRLGPERLFIGTLRDISERKAHTEALEYRALHDPLTGLANRALFSDRLRHALLLGEREKAPRALLTMDMDRFKEINDTFGHHCGDRLLQDVAGRLRHALRKSDTVARLGGDEFAVLPEGATSLEAAVTLAEKIHRALAEPWAIEGRSWASAASIGIAVYPEHAADADTLMLKADLAMYVAKRSRSGYAVYHDRYRDDRTKPAAA